VRVQLFDAYMTPGDHAPYQADRELLGFLRPETARQSNVVAKPVGGHLREAPWARAGGVERVGTGLYCQQHGKSLSVDHWEETCEY
jgi:hypothetical protein